MCVEYRIINGAVSYDENTIIVCINFDVLNSLLEEKMKLWEEENNKLC